MATKPQKVSPISTVKPGTKPAKPKVNAPKQTGQKKPGKAKPPLDSPYAN
jgi:hypothetical protein